MIKTAWIESHQKLGKHPKLLDLCNKTGWKEDETIGKLHKFWWWALDYAEDGFLNRFQPHQYLSIILTDNLTPENLLKILKETNFIDKDGKIHDWWDYAGRYLTAKYKTSNPDYLNKIEKIYKTAKKQTKNTLKTAHQPTFTNQPNQPNQDNLITSQIENLLTQFPPSLQTNIKTYWARAAVKNKSGLITEGRKFTMLNELFNSRERCKDDTAFAYALEQAITHDAPCIGYVNKVWANQKTKRPL